MDALAMDEKFRVVSKDSQNVPNAIYYVPEFIDCDEEEYLLRCIENSPKPKWTVLSNRRLQNWGGYPHKKGMLEEPLPSWLKTYCDKIAFLGIFAGNKPNHVLINEYHPGQGIMPHEDGPLFFPTVTTVNLRSHIVLDFYKKTTENYDTVESEVDYLKTNNGPTMDAGDAITSRKLEFSLLLKPRSLLVLREKAYTQYLHGIREVKEDIIDTTIANRSEDVKEGTSLTRDTRISLTIRYVPKVIKSSLFLPRK